MSSDFLNLNIPNYTPLEILIKHPDDFLKVRETLTRIGVASKKIELYFSPVIFCINRVDTLSSTLKNYLLWMANLPIYQKMIFKGEIL